MMLLSGHSAVVLGTLAVSEFQVVAGFRLSLEPDMYLRSSLLLG